MQGQSSILLVICLVSGCLSAPPPPFVEYQDSLGQYRFGYSAPGSARSEVRSLDGTTRGSYSYVDDAGMIQSAQYTADGERGFQIVATNLPQAPKPVEETPEVIAARLNHFKAIEEASTLAETIPEINVQPVIASSDGKAADSVVIENTSDSADDKIANQITAKSINSEEKAESQSEVTDTITKVTARIGIAEGPAESEENSEKSEKVKFAPIPYQLETADVIAPIVSGEGRASYVIPDGPHLNFKPVKNDTVLAPTFHFPKSAAVEAEQSPMPQEQAASFDPSAITPAGTRMSLNAGSETSGMIGESLPISGASEEATSSGRAQAYSATLIPTVQIVPSTSYQHVTYGIGINPYYSPYNPYRFFRYGIY